MLCKLTSFALFPLLWICCIITGSHALYVPGVTPKAYHIDERVPLQVNKIVSEKTQIPYAYGDLPFVCVPKEGLKRTWLNLGEVLRGDRLMNSDIELIVGRDTDCETLCTVTVNEEQSNYAKRLIQDEYHVEWIVDNLPGATVHKSDDASSEIVFPYFALGQMKNDRAYINNHMTMQLLYQTSSKNPDDKYIVGFEVYPTSYAEPALCQTHSPDAAMKEVGVGKTSITYTYSVVWKETKDITWATRWDRYLVFESRVHWYSIINSLVITMFLTGMVAMIILRTLKRDITSYNAEEDTEALEEDTNGWKLCHGDVFRPPKYSIILAPLLGSGVQCLIMAAATIVLSMLGFLNPSYRGGLISYGIAIYVLAGSFAGYFSARMHKVMKGQTWFRNALLTATIVPGTLLVVVFILNLFVWAQQSSSAIPFGTFFALISMWFGISVPLVFAGAVYGARKPLADLPLRTHQIPRQIPEQPWYLQLHVSMAVGGLMPFAVIFIELFFIFKSIWGDQYYYMFGFLALVFLILAMTTVEISIVIIYFSLCSEDYRWWWKSFAVSAASAFYMFGYSIFYYFTRLRVNGFVPATVYFGNSLMICFVYGLCMGTTGFFATFAFIRKIYAAIKID